jgi:macrodomain Ter protein organizer (MatP/YcbG family)
MSKVLLLEEKLNKLEALKDKMFKRGLYDTRSYYTSDDDTEKVSIDVEFTKNKKVNLTFDNKHNEAERIFLAMIEARKNITDSYWKEITSLKKELNLDY